MAYEVQSAAVLVSEDGGIEEVVSEVTLHGEFDSEADAQGLLDELIEQNSLRMEPCGWLWTDDSTGRSYWVEPPAA